MKSKDIAKFKWKGGSFLPFIPKFAIPKQKYLPMSNVFNPQINDQAFVDKLASDFKNARPYRHVVIENFLSEETANKLFSNFPDDADMSRHYKGLNEMKSEGSNFGAFDTAFSDVKKALNDENFRKTLEKITGITDVFSTDDAMGSGVHQGRNGSYLDVHIDFNIHHLSNVHRRLNLLIFLNKNWKESYGGKLELWNADVTKCEQEYLPLFNRCVIFETSDISYHGYSKITIPANESRKSFFCYYYTKPGKGIKYHDTIFKARPSEGTMKKVKTNVKETLKNNIKRTLKRLGIKF